MGATDGQADGNATLHDRNPTGRFSDRADAYKRYRPSYPAGAIDAVLDGLGDPSKVIVADIGAGTGISSRLLAERGVHVIAVEPNAAMREAAQVTPRITWVGSKAEETGLAAGSVDAVVCAQAFHWFDPVTALAEFHRVLRPGGRVALIWNDRDESDAFTHGYGELLRAASDRDPAMEDHTRPAALFGSLLFRNQRELLFANDQALDLDGVLGRALSASYIPKEGPKSEAVCAGLRWLHARLASPDGIVHLRYVTRVFLAETASQ
jgi:SAM-dependent methyltransferase